MVSKPLPLPTAPARIGSTPPWFNAKIDQYEHLDCLIIIFYNEDMGIVAGNDLPERKEAVRMWLRQKYRQKLQESDASSYACFQ